jgi:hypothetical protein
VESDLSDSLLRLPKVIVDAETRARITSAEDAFLFKTIDEEEENNIEIESVGASSSWKQPALVSLLSAEQRKSKASIKEDDTIDEKTKMNEVKDEVNIVEFGLPSSFNPAEITKRLLFISQLSRSVLASAAAVVATSNSASNSSISDTDVTLQLQTKCRSAVAQLLRAREALRRANSISSSQASRIAVLEDEARRAERTLERVRFARPDIEDVLRSINNTAQSGAELVASNSAAFTPMPLEKSATSSSSSSLTIKTPSDAVSATPFLLNVEARDGLIASTSLSETPSLSNDIAAAVAASEAKLLLVTKQLVEAKQHETSLSQKVKELNSLKEALETKLMEAAASLSIEKARADSNAESAVIERARAEELNLTVIQLQARSHINKDDVLSSTLYAERSSAWQKEKERADTLENKIVSIESNAASLLKSATSERVRAEEILSVLGIATSHVGIKSLEENVAQSDIRLRAALSTRDEALKKAADVSAQAESYQIAKKTIDEHSEVISRMQGQINALNIALSSKRKEEGCQDPERDGLMEALESVSAAFELASSDQARLLESLREKEKELLKRNEASSKQEMERFQLLAVIGEKDGQLREIRVAKTELEALVTAREILIKDLNSRCSTAESNAESLRREVEHIRGQLNLISRGGSVSDSVFDDLNKQITALRVRMLALEGDANDAIRSESIARQDAARAKLEASTSTATLQTMKLSLDKAVADREKALQAADKATKDASAMIASERASMSRQSSFTHKSSSFSATPSASPFALDIGEMKALKGAYYCSVCKATKRSCIISRCGHTFCRNCIDDRIKLRNRRCPSCNSGFAEADVLTMFLD